jgi:2,4-dienoyl-CoA reductase-like NADH-dependent reductase (Old Yellow Enzyme family)
MCTQLKAHGVDLVDVSTGGNVHNAPIKATPGFQVPFATAIRAETGIMTTAVGLITEPEQADHIIQTGEADAVFMAQRVSAQSTLSFIRCRKTWRENSMASSD